MSSCYEGVGAKAYQVWKLLAGGVTMTLMVRSQAYEHLNTLLCIRPGWRDGAGGEFGCL